MRELAVGRDSSGQAGDTGPDALGLAPWTGIHSGSRKMTALVKLLSSFLLMPTTSTVSIPIGSILDLTSRLSSITVPSPGVDVSNIINPEIGRDERESLWSGLPEIHVAVLNLLRTVIEALGNSSMSIVQNCLEQALWIFESEGFNKSIRTATYRLLDVALPIIGYSLVKPDVKSLAPAIRASCNDLLELVSSEKNEKSQRASGSSKGKSKGQSAISNADDFLNLKSKSSAGSVISLTTSATGTAASELLCTVLSCVPVELIPSSLRAELDRTSILVQNKQAMLASVLNPAPSNGRQRGHASILPFLARSSPADISVEGLLRPRMPVLMNGGGKGGMDLSVYGDEELDEQMDEDERVEISAHPTSFASAATEELLSNRSKRALETEVLRVDETLSPGKRVRTESHQATSVRTAGLNQGIADLPSLKPSVALTSSETRETISVPDFASSVAVEESIAPPATAEDQISSELRLSQPPTVQAAPAVEGDEESDDDIPVLNMDSDTDDEDDVMVE